ncbi:MAG TPA: hypothetical protein VFM56_13300 [Solimonas sp.]|nr:hypothetical protein [Solimonas sp.]
MRDPQSVKQCLDLAPAKAGIAWLSQVQRLTDINRSLPSWCAEPWVRQIRVANVRGQTVVVFSASAAALVPLRHRSSAFLHWLNDRYRLSCTRLDAKVRPPLAV